MTTTSEDTELGTSEAALLISGEELLSRDNIPDKNQSLICLSCDTKYVGLYCHQCGQKNDNMRRSLFSLIIDMVGNLTAIDSRIWRSWIKLLTRPGQVAREYADGRRTKWTSPVRAYLAMSILLFGYIAISGTQILSITMDVEREDGAPESIEALNLSDLRPHINLLMFETTRTLEEKQETSNKDLVDFILNYPDPLNIDFENGVFKFIELDTSNPQNLSTSITIDGESVSTEEASFRGVAALKLFLTRPQILNSYFSTYLPRIMLLMMPFTMFLGYIFIRRRGNALLFDHLVHTAYIHAVFFFLLLIGLILGQFTPIPSGLLMSLLAIYMLIYLPMSLKYMFKRGTVKTIWSSYAIGFIYFLTIIILLTILTLYGFVNLLQHTDISRLTN